MTSNYIVDVRLTASDGSVFFMYGGPKQSTSKAMIAAGHDLKVTFPPDT